MRQLGSLVLNLRDDGGELGEEDEEEGDEEEEALLQPGRSSGGDDEPAEGPAHEIEFCVQFGATELRAQALNLTTGREVRTRFAFRV